MSGAEEHGFNPTKVILTFVVDSAAFSLDPDDQSIDINDVTVHPNDLKITATTLSFTASLVNGLNTVSIYASDDQMGLLEGHYSLWAGTSTLPVTVKTESGTLVDNATVKVTLSDDTSVNVTGTSKNGVVSFSNIPARTLIVSALSTDGSYGSAYSVGNGNQVNIVVLPFNKPSSIDNNNFSLGTAGWNIGSAPVKIIDHLEGFPGATALKLNSALAVDQPDKDMDLSTSGEGEKHISRTFTIKAGTKNVSVRYRFITEEVPGGYFGSQFNDYYSISIQTDQGKTIVKKENSMNGLGLAAFDYNSGATAWKEVSLPNSETDYDVQVNVKVANVADGYLDSHVVIDFVDEKKLAIVQTILIDEDLEDNLAAAKTRKFQQTKNIAFISIDGYVHAIGNVNKIYGKVSIKGASDDKLSVLNLELLQGGKILKTVNLSSSAQPDLFKSFGESGKIEITKPILLFEIPPMSPLGADGKVLLRVYAETENGESVSKEYVSLQNLREYNGTNRYNERNEDEGGDGWGLPTTITYLSSNATATNWLIGDVSNINGGDFYPPHHSHKDGLDFDGQYDGYPKRDASVAKNFIDYLNSSLGARVTKIGISHTKTSDFYKAIKDVVLNDKRKATDIIRNWEGHKDHFHVRIKQPAAVANNNNLDASASSKLMQRGPIVTAQTQAATSNLKAYPNPAQGQVTISLDNKNSTGINQLSSLKQIYIFDKSGNIKKTYQFSLGTQNIQLNLSGLPPDIYTIKANDEKNRSSVIQITIVK